MLFVGCEEEYSIDHEFKPHLVVDGIFEAGKPWTISFKKTKNVLDQESNDRIDVNHTVVAIHDVRDHFLYNLHADNYGVYTNELHYPEAGKTYVLHVSSRDLPEVVARAKCPAYPEITFRSYSVSKASENFNVSLNFDIGEVSGSNVGYYWDIVFRRDENCEQNCRNYRDKLESPEIVYDIINPNVMSKALVDGRSELNINGVVSYGYSGDTFHRIQKLGTRGNGGEDLEGELEVEDVDGDDYDNDGTTQDMELVGLRVMTVDNELIDYYKQILQNPKISQYSSSSNYRKLKSNVKGGYGIFSGINVKTVTVN